MLKCRNYDVGFKVCVVLEVVKGECIVLELVVEYGVYLMMIY